MKKQIMIITTGIILILLFLVVKPFTTGEAIYSDDEQKTTLGYCPTMYEGVMKISEEKDYELKRFSSASETLASLKNNQIDIALIGRKAKQYETSEEVEEKIIESGYTLVSNKKEFIDYSRIKDIKIYTSLPEEIVYSLIPEDSKIKYVDKKEIFEKIKQGEKALISWDNWNDGLELVVVMNENEKNKNFRGVFLYE